MQIQQDAEFVARLPQELNACSLLVVTAKRIVLARIGIVDVIVAMQPFPGHAHRERVGQSDADGAYQAGGPQFAVRTREEGIQFLRIFTQVYNNRICILTFNLNSKCTKCGFPKIGKIVAK